MFLDIMQNHLLRAAILVALCTLGILGQSGENLVVINDVAYVRKAPNKTAKILMTVKKGAKFTAITLTPQRGWYHVSLLNGNFTGWIHGNDVAINQNTAQPAKTKDEWIFVYATSQADIYYNPAKIQSLGDHLANFWTKDVITDKQAYWRSLEKGGYEFSDKPEQNSNNLSHILYFNQIDCMNRKQGIKAVYTYGIKGDVWWSEENNQPLRLVIPESNGELLYQAICRYVK